MDRRYFVAFAGVDSKGRPRAERMCVCVCVCVWQVFLLRPACSVLKHGRSTPGWEKEQVFELIDWIIWWRRSLMASIQSVYRETIRWMVQWFLFRLAALLTHHTDRMRRTGWLLPDNTQTVAAAGGSAHERASLDGTRCCWRSCPAGWGWKINKYIKANSKHYSVRDWSRLRLSWSSFLTY